jgi:hypothetical protein
MGASHKRYEEGEKEAGQNPFAHVVIPDTTKYTPGTVKKSNLSHFTRVSQVEEIIR